jgi:hypothetical protein
VIELIEFGMKLGFDPPAAVARAMKKSAKRVGNYRSSQKMSQIKKVVLFFQDALPATVP